MQLARRCKVYVNGCLVDKKKQSKETKCGCSVEPAPVSRSTNYLILRYVQGVAYKGYAENKPYLGFGRQKK